MASENGGALVAGLLGLGEARSYRPLSVERRARDAIGVTDLEMLILTSPDGDEIPCLYLTPATPKPWPKAMIAIHQHAGRFDLGKSELAGLGGDPSLAYALRLAEAGFPTLVPDLIGFEDRQRSTDDSAAAERFDAFYRIADGSSLQAKHTMDVAVATSWLEDNDDIAGRIGIMGHSLGGQVSLFSLAFDNRLKAGVINCGIGTLASFREHQVPHNSAWFVPALIARGDTPVIAADILDRRVFVAAGTNDSLFPMQGVHEVVDAFAPGVCDFHESATGHELAARTLEEALSWLQLNL
jgi:dienelactone hydrolase